MALSSHFSMSRIFADAIGRTLEINHAPLRIIGVMPPEFFGETIGSVPDFWAPINLAPQLKMDFYLTASFGYLSPMARPPRAAQTELSTPPERAITTLPSTASRRISATARPIKASTSMVIVSLIARLGAAPCRR
jgi:hypothetical protein